MAMRLDGAFSWILLIANAAIGDHGIVVAHGLQPQGDGVDLIAYEWTSLAGQLPHRTRTANPSLVVAVMHGADRYADRSSEAGAVYARAVGRYRDALTFWPDENGLLAGEFLWLSAEALSRALVEAEAASLGITPHNLARLKKVNGPDQLYRLAREQTIFSVDEDALIALEAASHGFEHGFDELHSIRQKTGPILNRAARCVRHALIKALNLSRDEEAAILDSSLDVPLPILPERRALMGRVIVTDADAAPNTIQDAVEVDWHLRRDSIGSDAAGATPASTTEGSFRYAPLNVPSGMQFEPASWSCVPPRS